MPPEGSPTPDRTLTALASMPDVTLRAARPSGEPDRALRPDPGAMPPALGRMPARTAGQAGPPPDTFSWFLATLIWIAGPIFCTCASAFNACKYRRCDRSRIFW